MKWIKEIDNYNFLGIYDVMLDIKTEMNISPDRIIIPLLQHRVRFTQLFLIDSAGERDRYCDLRWKAIVFLKKNTIIKDFRLIKSSHRWDGKLEIELEKQIFEDVLDKMNVKYKKEILREISNTQNNKVVNDIMQNNQEKSKIKENSKEPKTFLMTNKNNEKMLYKIYLIASIALAIVSIIYYTTPWIKNFITYHEETKGDVITSEIKEGSEKIEGGIQSVKIKDKETINLEPRILVFIPEMHNEKEISDNSTEIAIINGLLKAGFVVINKHELDSIDQNTLIKKILKEDKLATLELAMDYEANVVIAGEAISKETGVISNFHSVQAYLEIRAYKIDEDKVIAAHSLQVSRAGITEDIAYKTAFSLAGEQMADYLVEKLAEFRNPEEIRTINLFIDNLINKSQFEKLKEAIGKMLLVTEVKVNFLENEKAELIVKTLGDVQELNEDLGNLTFINLEIKKVNDNLVQITVR